MYGIHCEVVSCAHNCSRMCFSPVPVYLKEKAVFGAIMLTCSEYTNRENIPVAETMRSVVQVRRENIVIN